MTGFPLIIAFIVAIVFMIVAISKFKIHPFLSIMGVSLILGLVAGIPLVGGETARPTHRRRRPQVRPVPGLPERTAAAPADAGRQPG